uniref:Uncharacterized protein n=1 Tax=Paramoeba aestuarina TaxID=180227 RepID=A0A6U3CSU2_9EUKA|mmetsp:Transcript_5085/g.7603  ORF Transcript_5085/g.7603 Transcript_5085/m.7603 type:complete len:256 (+) Transcript_5085:353-1120(+)
MIDSTLCHLVEGLLHRFYTVVFFFCPLWRKSNTNKEDEEEKERKEKEKEKENEMGREKQWECVQERGETDLKVTWLSDFSTGIDMERIHLVKGSVVRITSLTLNGRERESEARFLFDDGSTQVTIHAQGDILWESLQLHPQEVEQVRKYVQNQQNRSLRYYSRQFWKRNDVPHYDEGEEGTEVLGMLKGAIEQFEQIYHIQFFVKPKSRPRGETRKFSKHQIPVKVMGTAVLQLEKVKREPLRRLGWKLVDELMN